MKKYIPIAALALSLLFLVACQPNSAEPTAQEILEFMTAEELLGRRAGTPGNEQAGEYIAERFEAMGLEPFFEGYASPYTQIFYDIDTAAPALELTMADGTVHKLRFDVDFIYNLALIPGDIDLSLTVTDDINVKDSGGYALLADDAPAGARKMGFGLLLRVMEDNFIRIHNSSKESDGTSYIYIKESFFNALTPGASLKLTAKECKREPTLNNYIAVKRGADSSRAFIVMAHFDGAGGRPGKYSQGAIDNASGLAAMLRCAALLKDVETPYDIVFCAFNGEEVGLMGSAAVAPKIEAAYKECVVLNIDCVGQSGNTTYSIIEGQEMYDSSAIVALFKKVMDNHQISYGNADYGGSDHRSFRCPSVIVGASSPVFHTTGDTIDKLDIKEIEAVAAMAADFVSTYSGPFDHQIPMASNDAEYYTSAALDAIAQMGDALPMLEYDESYTFMVQEGVFATVTGWGALLEHRQLEQYYPTGVVPATVGDYSFFSALVHDSRGGATLDDPRITFELPPGAVLDETYKAEFSPVFVVVMYKNQNGDIVELSVVKNRYPVDYSNRSVYMPVEGMPEGAEAHIRIYPDDATGVAFCYDTEAMQYSLSFIDVDLPFDTLEDYSKMGMKLVPVEQLMELYELFIVPGIEATLD